MFKLIVLLTLLLSVSAFGSAKYSVGQREFTFEDRSRSRAIFTYVWYPIRVDVKMTPSMEKGRPFLPIVAAKGATTAKPPSGGFPVVLLSHGSMGEAKRLFWLAEALVREGFVAVAVDHPGNKTGDSSGDGVMRVWDRAKDLSFVLDKIFSETEFKNQLNSKKTVAAGHSAGGATVLMLAGARFSWERLQNPTPKCGGTKEPFFAKQCAELSAIKMTKFPKETVEADYYDPRVKAVVALDPGFIRSFQVDTLRKLKVPAKLFVADKLETPFDESYSREYLQVFPTSAELLPNTYHMTFLTACKPGLEKSGDPELAVLCSGNDRKKQVQKEVAAKAMVFFNNAIE